MRITQIEKQIASYWEGLRDGRPVPYRSEVDPRGLEGVLEYMFILERTGDGQARLRVAGMHLNRLMGMEVRGMEISSLFVPDVRVEVVRAFDRVFDTPAHMGFDLAGRTGRVVAFPLRGPSGNVDRAMGCVVAPGSETSTDTPTRLDIGHVELSPIAGSSRHIQGQRTATGMEDPPASFDRTPRRRPVLRVIRNDTTD